MTGMLFSFLLSVSEIFIFFEVAFDKDIFLYDLFFESIVLFCEFENVLLIQL